MTKSENVLMVQKLAKSCSSHCFRFRGAKRKVKTCKALLTTKLNMNILVLLRENLVIFLCDCLEHTFYFQYFSRSQFIRVSFIVMF